MQHLAQWQPATRTVLVEQLRVEADPKVKAAMQAALKSVEERLRWGEWLAVCSRREPGSILLLVAMGLAITYGVMGVINMAHGELMMIGAYATYVVQGVSSGICRARLTGTWWPLPVAFLASALVGAALSAALSAFL